MAGLARVERNAAVRDEGDLVAHSRLWNVASFAVYFEVLAGEYELSVVMIKQLGFFPEFFCVAGVAGYFLELTIVG